MAIGQFEVDAYGVGRHLLLGRNRLRFLVTGASGDTARDRASRLLNSQIGEPSYKRLTRALQVPAGGGHLGFQAFYETESDFDFLFVEQRTAGGEGLDHASGPERPHSHRTAARGPVLGAHPFLAHYMTGVFLDER